MSVKKKKIVLVVGTRPNFIKITQFPRVLNSYADKIEYKVIHTGQHFDDKMSTVFFQQFGIIPDVFLNIDGGVKNSQVNAIMDGLEREFAKSLPDIVITVGDVNSTAAAALAAKKLGIKVAHVESGLRSFDPTMPEEHNRILTDSISDYFFITEQSGMDNLLKEGKSPGKLFFVGNTMIDTMVAFEKQINAADILKRLDVEEKKYVLMTMHRPATVDSKEGLVKLSELIGKVSEKYKIVFPIHPRTVNNLRDFGLYDKLFSNRQLIITDPLDYFSFQKLIKECKFILTDSGGIQEESTFRRVPCLTLRANTERPSTVTIGTNELIIFSADAVQAKMAEIEQGKYKKGNIPPLWDGKATQRIVGILSKVLE